MLTSTKTEKEDKKTVLNLAFSEEENTSLHPPHKRKTV